MKKQKKYPTSNFFFYICAVLTNQLSTMKSFKTFSIILAVVVACFAAGCGSGVFGEKIDECVITYRLEYPKDNKKSPLIDLLPEQMTLSFKDDKSSMLIKGYAGCFSMQCVSDYKNKKNTTLLSIGLWEKYMLETQLGDTPFETSSMSDLEVKVTTDTMSVCGYKCTKAIGHSDNCERDFTFWFTKEIDNKSANMISPAQNIKGVLMQFDIEMMGVYMKAKAIEVCRQEVPDDAFEIPSGYDKVTRSELEDVIRRYSFDSTAK